MRKTIPIDLLKPGMYIASLDQSWFKTPFLRHKWLIKRHDEIRLLKEYGIQEVVIDTARGLDTVVQEEPQEEGTPRESLTDSPSTGASTPGNNHTEPDPEEIRIARSLRSEAIYALETFFHTIDERQQDTSLEQVRTIVSTLLDGLLAHQAAMVSLIQMRRFDQNLSTHAVDTCVLSLALGKELEWDLPRLKTLGLGALLHDIGQLRLPLNVLRKKTRFTQQDHKLMQTHPQMGMNIVSRRPDIPEEVRGMIFDHHERIDGTGYPRGLRGEEISPFTQLLSVADTYDAQISGRCSLPPVPPAHAVRELYESGIQGQFDSELVQRLIRFLGVYPIGSLVELNTGERAVVAWVHPHSRLNPSIKLVSDPTGRPYKEQDLLDLSAKSPKGPTRRIVRALDPRQEHVDVRSILESLW